jgi:hypothetical protein
VTVGKSLGKIQFSSSAYTCGFQHWNLAALILPVFVIEAEVLLSLCNSSYDITSSGD